MFVSPDVDAVVWCQPHPVALGDTERVEELLELLELLLELPELLDEGCADMFGLSRPFIAEPDLVNRWAEDDARPSACVSCNACLKTASRGHVNCPVMRDREEGEWAPL